MSLFVIHFAFNNLTLKTFSVKIAHIRFHHKKVLPVEEKVINNFYKKKISHCDDFRRWMQWWYLSFFVSCFIQSVIYGIYL
jgi:hypothetical protein